MSKTNCINCGAAKDTSEIKCPFCGTTYLDFTGIDFTSGDPVVCQFVMPCNSNGKMILSMLAIPQLNEVSVQHDYHYVYGGFHNTPIVAYRTGTDMRFDIEFKPVVKPTNAGDELYNIRLEE